jgi:hypothetical protein
VIYFDPSYLVRLYVEDPGWEAVRALAATDDVASAVHGRTETVAAFHRILREGHVDVLRFGELLKQFQDDCAASGLHWLPLTDAALSRVETAYASLELLVGALPELPLDDRIAARGRNRLAGRVGTASLAP